MHDATVRRSITLDQALDMSPSALAALPAEALCQLKHEVTECVQAAKGFADHLDHALEIKYAEAARALRLRQGKDSGTVQLEDGPVRVIAELPKRIEWDQAQLAAIVKRIAGQGEDPSEFVEVSYKIAEAKYKAWPAALRDAFAPARTLKTGKPSYRLTAVEVAP